MSIELDNLLANDGILPSQQDGRQERRNPIRDLHAAILDIAMRDVWAGMQRGSSTGNRRRGREALEWFTRTEDTRELGFTFDFVCDVLGFNPALCREAILAMLPSWSSGSKFFMPRMSPRGGQSKVRLKTHHTNRTAYAPRHIAALPAPVGAEACR
jgi:hypothetical protein